MKKVVSLLLTLLMVLFALSANAEAVDPQAAEDAAPLTQADYEEYVSRDVAQELVVGSMTQLSGSFFTDMWGNNTADIDVRTLIHGYNTVTWGRNGDFLIDPIVVAETKINDDANHNRTYTFTIHDDLTYSDGTPITAKDYVFSALLISSPVLTEFGGVPTTLKHLVGYEAFREGFSFSGIRLLGEYTFSLTIDRAYLPYYYELALVNVNPYPAGVIAPGCDVVDIGGGAYIEGPFVPELVERTVLAEDGYLHRPMVTSGPYALTGFDGETKVATFVRNEYYKGNYEGWKPFIEKLRFVMADPVTMLDDLKEGRLDVINKISSVDSIYGAMGMQATGDARFINYPRTGFTFVSFACELGATESVKVRKAVAMCLDEDALITGYVPDFAQAVYGYYGMAQWMAQRSYEDLQTLAVYGYNPDGANELLDQDGWLYNEDGTEYEWNSGAVRYRENEEGALEELALNYAYPVDNELGLMVKEMLEANLTAIGVRLEMTELPFPELLLHYYRQVEREYNLMSLATNFSVVFDPYYTYSVEDIFQGVFNTTGIRDEKLMALAQEMRKTEPGDDATYYDKWLAFQKYWVSVLPMAPLYSNVYGDATRPDLQNYATNAHFSWASAIVYSYLGEEMPDQEAAGSDGELLDSVTLEG